MADRVEPGASFGTVELRGGDARVVLIPELGGKIAELWFGGRQWLWRNSQLPYRAPVPGASYVMTADTGGLDECFPTVSPCALPSLVRALGGRELPDHGELWSQAPEIAITTAETGHRAHVVWRGTVLPYCFERSLVVTPQGAVRCDYAVTNEGDARLPFVWAAHPLLPLGRETRIVAPDGARVRVFSEHGIGLGGAGAEHRWPIARHGGQQFDLSVPARLCKQGFACMLYLDLPPGSQTMRVVEGGEELRVALDGSDVTHFGMWINHGGWNPLPRTSVLPWRRPAPYVNLGFEPAIGAPGMLSEALGAWEAAAWLEAGATRRWSLTWSGGSTGPQ